MDPRRTLGPRDFWVLIIVYPKSLGPTKCWSKKILTLKKLAPKSLVKIGSDIDDMDKCNQDKCCMDKCHLDVWHPTQKPTFKDWSKLVQ